jgi:2-desacetyl-2-hydroxyethyl bacteriochlorophyllide A dehydrogenase
MGMKTRQLMLVDKNRVELEETQVTMGTADILVKSRYSLISPGTELALFTGTHIGFNDPEIAWARYPIRPGYASVGTVEEAGSEALGYSVGDHVLYFQPHADHSVFDPKKELIFRLPAGIDERAALFARFGQIAYTAVAASGLAEGWVLVLGGGIVGNLCAQLFQARRGRRVVVADLAPSRVALALRSGIGAAICNSDHGLREALLEVTGGEGVSTVVEATGVPSLVADALDLVNRLGEVILLGSTRGKVELDVYKRIHRKAVALIGAHESRYPRFGASASQDYFGSDVISMIADGTMKVEGFITDTVSPMDVGKAYRMLLDEQEKHLGVLIDWE